MFRMLLGAIGRMLLTAEDKKALRTSYLFRLYVTEAEVWLCGFPQMRYALQYVRVRVLGPGSAPHKCLQTDEEAHVDITTFREKMRRLYDDDTQNFNEQQRRQFQSACIMNKVRKVGEFFDTKELETAPKWYTCQVCKRSQPAKNSKKCCGYYLTHLMEEEPVLNFDIEKGIH